MKLCKWHTLVFRCPSCGHDSNYAAEIVEGLKINDFSREEVDPDLSGDLKLAATLPRFQERQRIDRHVAALSHPQQAVKIDVARLVEARLERERLERELALASEIQQRFQPTAPPVVAGSAAQEARLSAQAAVSGGSGRSQASA